MALFGHDDEAVYEILKGLIKLGEVSSVDAAAGTARVVFDDDDSIVSGELQVLHRNTFANKDYNMPDVGEDVLCIFLPTGTEDGFILGSVYAEEVKPPAETIEKRVIEFSDGARFEYDRENHIFNAQIDETSITADAEKIEVKSGGVTFTLEDNKATIEADNIELGGKTTISGDLTVSGKADISGDVTGAEFTAGATKLTKHTHNYTCSVTGAPAPTTPPLA